MKKFSMDNNYGEFRQAVVNGDRTICTDRIRGCLLGGAMGDALGAPLEFKWTEEIIDTYGGKIADRYLFPLIEDTACFTDDTQMTLFTADALNIAEAMPRYRDRMPHVLHYIKECYLDWLVTQRTSFEEFMARGPKAGTDFISSMMYFPDLFHRRAPGNTCLDSLDLILRNDIDLDDYISDVRNDSKGCGGVMRVAPIALKYKPSSEFTIEDIDMLRAQASAITHTHPLGYMSSSVLVHILNRIIYPEKEMSLEEIVLQARDTVCGMFAGYRHVDELRDIIDKAVRLSRNGKKDLTNLIDIGEGWVAEETLAIAVYCALRYEENFSKAICVAASHDGDSDSTAEVTGNIVGAMIGYDAIPQQWKDNLQLRGLLLDTADRLAK